MSNRQLPERHGKLRRLSSPVTGSDQLQSIVESVNETARLARLNVSFTLVGALYLALTLLSTTDESLFHNATMNLPQIEAGITLKQNYVFASVVFLYLHLQIMFLLLVLLQKIERFEHVLHATFAHANNQEKEEYWDWLSAASFVQGFVDARGSKYLARALSFVATAIIPLALLLLIDLSFVRFQSLWISCLHHICFLTDFVAICYFYWRVGQHRRQASAKDGLWRLVRTSSKLGMMAGIILTVALLTFARPPTYPPHENTDDAGMFQKTGNFNPFDVGLCSLESQRGFCRKLRLNDIELGERPTSPDDVKGLDMRQRTFRYADFGSAAVSGVEFVEADLRGASFRDASLQRVSFSGADLRGGADLRVTNAENVVWDGAKFDADALVTLLSARMNLSEADLSGIDPSGISIAQVDLQGAFLAGVNLGGVNLIEAVLQGADLTGADLRGADLTLASLPAAVLKRVDLAEASLRGVDATGADLTGADLQNANLRDAGLTGANLTDADLRRADLTLARLPAAVLKGVDLTEASLRGVEAAGADLTGANLRRIDLRDAGLTGAILFRVDLTEASLTEANLTRGDLRRADLRGADLTEADLRGADLTGADLRGAKLKGTNLQGADLTRVRRSVPGFSAPSGVQRLMP